MTNDSEWTDWIEHKAGDPCPIPDVKAGEFELCLPSGFVLRPALHNASEFKEDFQSGGVVSYRLRKPPVDWKAIADELATAINGLIEWDQQRKHIVVYRVRDPLLKAITHYREAISNNQEKNP